MQGSPILPIVVVAFLLPSEAQPAAKPAFDDRGREVQFAQRGGRLPVVAPHAHVIHRPDEIAIEPQQSGTASLSTEIPISILSASMGSRPDEVVFVVQNVGIKDITAWEVRIEVGTPPETKTGGYETDSYRPFAGVVPCGTHIAPGGTRTIIAKLPVGSEALSPILVVTPTAAVFADKSYAGDEKFATFVFERRAAERAAWLEVVAHLERAEQEPAGLPGLEAALTQVNSSILRNGDDIVRKTIRANLSVAIRDVREGRASAASKIRSLLDDARRNLAAATIHSAKQ